MKTTVLAIRNLGRQKRRSLLLGGAIAFGIFIVTFVNGAAGGLARNLERNFSQLLGGEIFLQGVQKDAAGKRTEVITDDAALAAAIESSRIPVQSITRSSSFLATFLFHGATAVQEVVGIDFSRGSSLQGRLTLTAGSFDGMSDRQGIILGQQTAQRLKAQVGDTVVVRLRTITGQMNVGEFRLAATSHDPGLAATFAAYANREYVNELEGLPTGAYQQLGILLGDTTGTAAAAAQLSRALSEKVTLFAPVVRKPGGMGMSSMMQEHNENPMGAMVQDLMSQAGDESYTGTRYRLSTIDDILGRLNLPMIIGAINGVAFAVLLVLCLIIAVGVVNTFRIILNERTREIGTMRALGMQRGRVRSLFLMEALFLFLGSAATGVAAAFVLMQVARLARFTPETPVYLMLHDGRLAFAVSPGAVLAAAVMVGLLTMLAAWLPARRAAKMKPVTALSVAH
jgi:putative ABC transport system permease protein